MHKTAGSRILIAGGLGFIGSHFVNYALERDCVVLNLDACTYAANPKGVIKKSFRHNYQFLEGHIENATLIKAVMKDFKPQFLINFAAETHVDNSIFSPNAFIKTNINGTFNLIDQTRIYLEKYNIEKFKFINVSTDEVYGSISKKGNFTESSPYAPNSPYSASKASADMLVRSYVNTYKFPAITTNCSNNFGPYQHSEKFIPKIVRNAIKDTEIPIYGDGQNVRDWLYVGDHVTMLFLLMFSETKYRHYNIGGGTKLSNKNLLDLILKYMADKKFLLPDFDKIRFVEDRKGHDFRYSIDDSRFRSEFSWKNETTNFEEKLGQTIDWYVAHEMSE